MKFRLNISKVAKHGLRLTTEQSGITGLETAIVLIAFVVVATVFSFTVMTTGLFTSKETQDASKAALSTTDSSLKMIGELVGGGTCLDVNQPALGYSFPCHRGGSGQSPGMTNGIDWASCPFVPGEPHAYDDGSTGCASAHVQLIRFKLIPSGNEAVIFDAATTKITWMDNRSPNGLYTDLSIQTGNMPPGLREGEVGQGEAEAQRCIRDGWCYRFEEGETDQILEPGEFVEIFIGARGGDLHPLGKRIDFVIEIIPMTGNVVQISGKVPAVLHQVMSMRP